MSEVEMRMRYSEPLPISKRDVLNALSSEDTDFAVGAIIRMSYCESDGEWAERTCLIALSDSRQPVKLAALTGIGHLARRFETLSCDQTLSSVQGLLSDPDYRGAAEDTLDDISIFVHNRHVQQ